MNSAVPPPAQPVPPQAPQPTQASAPRQPILLGVLAVVLGALAIPLAIFAWAGIVAGLAAVVLGVIALRKRLSKPLPITGIVLGAIGALMSMFMTYFLIFGFPQPEGKSVAELQEEWEQEQSIEEPSSGIEFPDEVDPAEFTEVDESELDAILAEPESHAGESIVVYGTYGEPLMHDSAAGLGMCLMQFYASADPEAADAEPTANVMGLGEAVNEECEMVDRFLDSGEEGLSADTLTTVRKVYAVVLGPSPVESPDGETRPGLVVLEVE